ncbi:response regulator transcription factor [Microvirga sp. 3-52]|nr:response regulator transcription factor [Microvirga sp. 3-52]
MRVLLIEDDISVTQSIELMLQRLDVQISVADLGEHGIDLGRLPDYDIILLDLNLPDMSGYEVLRQLRLAKVSTPVLILSGLDGTQNKVRGLGYGADDYLTKPFHKDELIARIQAIIRRSSEQVEAVLQCGDLTISPQAQQAEVGGRQVNLTGTEYKILAFLAQRQGSTLTKEMLLNHLYSGMDEPAIKIIDVFICKLRRKLAEASGGRDYIETVWGRGYMLREPHVVKLAS